MNYTQRNYKLEFYSIGKEWKYTVLWNVEKMWNERFAKLIFFVYYGIIVGYLFLIVVCY